MSLLTNSARRTFWSVLILALLVGMATTDAFAQSPFGVAVPSQPAPLVTPADEGFLGWIATKQAAYYRSLTDAVGSLRTDASAIWLLVVLSFLYGVFHAAGPGHGKVIVSSYALADGQILRRGMILAMASSLAQAVTAVIVIGVAAALLNWTAVAISASAAWLAFGSYVLVTLIGLWLVWRKIIQPMGETILHRMETGNPFAISGIAIGHHNPHVHSRDAHEHHHGSQDHKAHAGHGHHHHHAHSHSHEHSHSHDHDGHGHPHHGPDAVCSSCGHQHAPDPKQLASGLFSRESLMVVLSIGLRPCSGALIVLVFALSQGAFTAGVAATFAMAIGTGLTVAALAAMAVGARDLAVAVTGGAASGWAGRIHRGFEAVGALAVLSLGILLMLAALVNAS